MADQWEQDWARFWLKRKIQGGLPEPLRPADPAHADERPAVSGWIYVAINNGDPVLRLTVPGLGTLCIRCREHPDDPQGYLESVSVSLAR